jgi:hypothetical protein
MKNTMGDYSIPAIWIYNGCLSLFQRWRELE